MSSCADAFHQLKRQHSFDPPHTSASPAARALSQSKSNSPADSPPALLTNAVYDPKTSTDQDSKDAWPSVNTNQDSWAEQEKDLWGGAGSSLRKEEDQAIIGSPLKKQRASVSGNNDFKPRVSSLGNVSNNLGEAMGLGFLADIPGAGETGAGQFGGDLKKVDEITSGTRAVGGGSALSNVGPAFATQPKADTMEEEL